jgi:hypothetical protein
MQRFLETKNHVHDCDVNCWLVRGPTIKSSLGSSLQATTRRNKLFLLQNVMYQSDSRECSVCEISGSHGGECEDVFWSLRRVVLYGMEAYAHLKVSEFLQQYTAEPGRQSY